MWCKTLFKTIVLVKRGRNKILDTFSCLLFVNDFRSRVYFLVDDRFVYKQMHVFSRWLLSVVANTCKTFCPLGSTDPDGEDI